MDHAATTPLAPEAVDAMGPYLGERYGNPSALYRIGREARAVLEESRKTVSGLIGASPDEIYFTSGGSESDNMALVGALVANRSKGNHIVTTEIEHHAVLETAEFLKRRGFGVTFVGVDSHGEVEPDDVRKAIRPETVLVSVMHANNEVGTIEPVARISEICREAGVYFHSDAVQTVGNIPVDVGELGVDMLSISGHKLYGPKGVGAVYIRKGTRISKFIHGGEQERDMRAGTENMPGIVGLGEAARVAVEYMGDRGERIRGLRDRLAAGILERVDDVIMNGHPDRRLPNNLSLCFKYIEGEAVCLQLDTVGICASAGAACTTETLEPSHVLTAMGIPDDDAMGAVRFSLGRGNTDEDVDYVLEQLPPMVERLRSMSPLAPR